MKETVAFIESRLEELDEEKEELEKYVKLDKAKRSIEYAIYDKELSEARQKLDDVEEKKTRERTSEDDGGRNDRREIGGERVGESDEKCREEIERLSREVMGIEVERKEIGERRATKSWTCKIYRSRSNASRCKKRTRRTKNRRWKNEQKIFGTELSKVKPEFVA